MSNAKLLQTAQLRLLYDDGQKQRSEPDIDFSPLVDSTKNEISGRYYRHPYFWSGFILADSVD